MFHWESDLLVICPKAEQVLLSTHTPRSNCLGVLSRVSLLGCSKQSFTEFYKFI